MSLMEDPLPMPISSLREGAYGRCQGCRAWHKKSVKTDWMASGGQSLVLCLGSLLNPSSRRDFLAAPLVGATGGSGAL